MKHEGDWPCIVCGSVCGMPVREKLAIAASSKQVKHFKDMKHDSRKLAVE